MNFIYNDNVLDINKVIDNNKENIKDIRRNFSIITIGNNIYFVKTINKKISETRTQIMNPNSDKEVDPTNQVTTYLSTNHKYEKLFVTIHSISQKDQCDYYVMDYIAYGDFTNMLPVLNSKWKFTLLMQSLASIYILNHKIKLFHNDLYYEGIIRNIMVDKVDKPYSIDLHINNTQLVLNVKKFCVKMIDFGRCASKQGFRTTEYHSKHFSKIKYVSEPLIFTYFFFKTFGFDEFNMLNHYGLEIEKTVGSLVEFDSKFLLKIHNRYKKYIN